MKRRYVVHWTVAALALAAIGFGVTRPVPAAPTSSTRETRDDATRYWMSRARAAEAKARTLTRQAAAQRRAQRAALLHRVSSVEALRLAAISSSADPSEQQAMYRTLYALAACETTGTTGRRLPWPPSERVLNHRAQNPTGEHASGLHQYLPSTWRTTPYAGESIWSPYAQALATAWMIKHGRLREWSCAWAVTR